MAIEDKTIIYKGPPGSCDCHMHVFGDPVRYPYAADRRNSPPADPLEKFLDDYPFLSHADRVSAVALFNLIPTWAPDESVRKQILVDNPQELFGF